MEKKVMQLPLAQRMEGIGEYYFSQKLREIDQLRAEGQDIISLGIGGPDLPPHPEVIARLSAEALKPNVHSYQPYKGSAILREAFAQWYAKYYGVTLDPVTEVLPLLGSKEGLMHICMTYLGPGDKVLLPNPGYPTYTSAASLSGAECVTYALRAENNWMPNFEEIEAAGMQGVKMMIVNYPNMPTGAIAEAGLFQRLVDFARKHNILLVHDNPYSFVRNDDPQSILSVKGAMEVTLELNSLSKSHCMAGWRVGMVAGAAQRLNEIICFKSNMDSGMFYPVQAAAATALALGEEWYGPLNAEYRLREDKGRELMELMGCECAAHQAGLFLWGRLPESLGDGFACSDKFLYGCGVFMTPGGIFGSEGNSYIRICLCVPVETLQKAIDRVKTML